MHIRAPQNELAGPKTASGIFSETIAMLRHAAASQAVELQQEKTSRSYDFAPASPLAAENVGRIDDSASAATTVGRRGQQNSFPNPNHPVPRNTSGTVNNREFSGHAFDRMQERGFTPSVIENAIQHGTRTPGRTPGTFQHFDPVNKFNVITDGATGRVITVF
jgi:filamentous hemagglutinin